MHKVLNHMSCLQVERVEQYFSSKDQPAEIKAFHAHLSSLDAYNILPLQEWMNSCFAEVLPGNSHERYCEI